MQSQFSIFLFNAGEHCAPVKSPYEPVTILHGSSTSLRHGDNGLFIDNSDDLRVHAMQRSDGPTELFEPFDYSLCYFSRSQRVASDSSALILQELLKRGAGRDAPDAASLAPMTIALVERGQVRLYRYLQQAEHGALFLAYFDAPWSSGYSSWKQWIGLLGAGHVRLRMAWPLFNDDCWFTKWRADVEMERKFTFTGLPDTWLLVNSLYEEILQRRMDGFIPELDRDFQVFDYESHVYEVSGEQQEAGYVSFIPQADGRMTVKRKWFVQNTEIRRETVIGNQELTLDGIDAYAASMTRATLRKMPVFRRKRFDVNFESLRTGNIYGVYFDICRTESPLNAFSQCEVEYCRTRTLWPLREVIAEFEVAANYTADFLARKGIDFRHDTFSKLDFVRQSSAKLNTVPRAAI